MAEQKEENIPPPPAGNNHLLKAALFALMAIAIVAPQLGAPIYNAIIRRWYLPDEVISYYTQNPVNDVRIHIKTIYSAEDLAMEDLGQAIEIQFNGRVKSPKKDNVVPEVLLSCQEGNYKDYEAGKYDNSTLFVRTRISDSNGIFVESGRNYGEMFYTLESVDNNDLPYFMVQMIADNAYNEEIAHYKYASFNKVVSENQTLLMHNDYLRDVRIRRAMWGEKTKFTARFVLCGSDRFTWDMQQAIEEQLKPQLDRLDEFFDLTILYEGVESVSDEARSEEFQKIESGELNYGDIGYPEGVNRATELAHYFRATEGHDYSNVHLALYPVDLNIAGLEASDVNGSPIYSDSENSILKVMGWGMFYFGHTTRKNPTHFSAEDLRDTVVSFSESILDTFGAPNSNMNPVIRIDMYERILVVNFLTHYSSLLQYIYSHLNQQNNKYIDGSVVDTITTTLGIRDTVISLMEKDDVETALKNARKMVLITEDQLDKLGILEKVKSEMEDNARQIHEQQDQERRQD